jgi:hypothetical protein
MAKIMPKWHRLCQNGIDYAKVMANNDKNGIEYAKISIICQTVLDCA